MGDPLFYPNMWKRQRDNTGDDNMDLNWVTRKLNKLDNETARLNALLALSNAVDEARRDEDQRRRDREALRDPYYGHELLRANGICPLCLYPLDGECQCESAE